MRHVEERPQIAFLIPTWENHYPIFHFMKKISEINMYDKKNNGFLFDHVLDQINKLEPRSVLLMQACANNPTGIDPSEQQWVAISRACKDKKIFPLLDSAYMGLISGDVAKDAFAIRLLQEDGHEFAYTQSYSKNLALYGERIGITHYVCKSKEKAKEIKEYFA